MSKIQKEASLRPFSIKGSISKHKRRGGSLYLKPSVSLAHSLCCFLSKYSQLMFHCIQVKKWSIVQAPTTLWIQYLMEMCFIIYKLCILLKLYTILNLHSQNNSPSWLVIVIKATMWSFWLLIVLWGSLFALVTSTRAHMHGHKHPDD